MTLELTVHLYIGDRSFDATTRREGWVAEGWAKHNLSGTPSYEYENNQTSNLETLYVRLKTCDGEWLNHYTDFIIFASIGNYDRQTVAPRDQPTDQQTDMRGHGEVTLQ